MSTKGKFALGALFGAAVGVVAGILTAPKSGKETREDVGKAVKKTGADIAEKSEDIKDKAEVIAKDTKEKATKVAGEVKEKASDVVEDVKEKSSDLTRRTGNAIEGAKKGFKSEK